MTENDQELKTSGMKNDETLIAIEITNDEQLNCECDNNE